MKKRILSIIICAFLLLGLTACGKGEYKPAQKAFDTKVMSSVPSENKEIAKNAKYTMQYDSATGGIKIVDNATGTVWGTNPAQEGEQELST